MKKISNSLWKATEKLKKQKCEIHPPLRNTKPEPSELTPGEIKFEKQLKK